MERKKEGRNLGRVFFMAVAILCIENTFLTHYALAEQVRLNGQSLGNSSETDNRAHKDVATQQALRQNSPLNEMRNGVQFYAQPLPSYSAQTISRNLVFSQTVTDISNMHSGFRGVSRINSAAHLRANLRHNLIGNSQNGAALNLGFDWMDDATYGETSIGVGIARGEAFTQLGGSGRWLLRGQIAVRKPIVQNQDRLWDTLDKLNLTGTPLKRLSMAESGIEIRTMLRENITLVGFAQAVKPFDNAMPDHGYDRSLGLSVEMRTKAGPIQFDFIKPLSGDGVLAGIRYRVKF